MYIEANNLSKEFTQQGKNFSVFSQLSLSIEKGEFVCLLGPSGCGKSTLLSILAGFERASSGSVKIDGEAVLRPSIRYVTIFQNYGLLPWRTVRRNVELGLETQKIPKEKRGEIAITYLEMVGLSEAANRYPHQLSGGMQQRVAIARALAVDPDVLFMDEPFGALDAITRIKMQDDILAIARQQKKTIVFVTHDIDEAVFLADRIVVMTPNPGKISAIIPVTLRNRRDRTADDFLHIRNKVFRLFQMGKEENLEYYL